jgi:uncharacterized protein YuzE
VSLENLLGRSLERVAPDRAGIARMRTAGCKEGGLRHMRIRYDEKVDALYLRLDDSKVVESEEVKPGIVLDFNAKKQVVGIEVLDLKRRVPKGDLKQLKVLVA